MALDLNTLLLVTVLSAAIAGGLLLLSFSFYRNVPALAYWGAGFLLGAAGAALIFARGTIPDLWSIVAGNALLALAYGLTWGGIRNFEGRRALLWVILAGAAIWLAACQIELFYENMTARVVMMALIGTVYTALNIYELWNARDPAPTLRWPIIVLLAIHVVAFLVRIPLASSLALPIPLDDAHEHWLFLIVLEAIFNTFCLCYLLGSMVHERIAMLYHRDSMMDSLTGVNNRRSFLQKAERILTRANADGTMVALLLFDLDHFKRINDKHGHLGGDLVLKHFCKIATDTLRPSDLFGRIGGEEFGCLIYPSSLRSSMQVGERVRQTLMSTPFTLNGMPLRLTVSIGIAVAAGETLEALMANADTALYRAKAKGRNRVEPQTVSVVWPGQAAAS